EACASGLSVSTSITPCGLILTARIALTGTPPLTTPLTARVTSACRNVEGVRAISPPLHQQIQCTRERPRGRAVAVAGERRRWAKNRLTRGDPGPSWSQ